LNRSATTTAARSFAAFRNWIATPFTKPVKVPSGRLRRRLSWWIAVERCWDTTGLAIHRELQGQKLGRFLLMDALHRSWKNTAEVASIGVVAEAYDEAARTFYLRHEFIPLAEHPKKLFIAMATIQQAFA
jgi:GNAT superfamily N-acetyltransferase